MYRKFPFSLWFIVIVLVVVLAALVLFFILPPGPATIYLSAESLKQGDTVFIRIKTEADEVAGSMGSEKIVFYRKGNTNEWISFLGIDADKAPGEYTISVDTSKAEHLKKNINVVLADFSSAPAAAAPSAPQNGISNQKAVDNIVKNDNPSLKKILNNFTQQPYFSTPFSLPLSKIQKTGYPFGKFIGFTKDKLQHLGVDLRASEKTNVYAVNDGKVVATLNLSNYGKTVIIDHGLGIFSLYLHLDEFKVSQEDTVKRGQTIALSGETGYVTAPHLHFSMRVGTSRVDPLAFIDATKNMNDNFFLADISDAFFNLINKIFK